MLDAEKRAEAMVVNATENFILTCRRGSVVADDPIASGMVPFIYFVVGLRCLDRAMTAG